MEFFFQSFTSISDIPHSRYCRDGRGREGEREGGGEREGEGGGERSQRYIPKNGLGQKIFVC